MNFEPRPFAKFLGNGRNVVELESNSKTNLMVKETIPDFAVNDKPRKGLYSKGLYLFLVIVDVFSVGYLVKDVALPEKQCMQWQNDHYELLDCQSENKSLFASSSIIPYDENTVELHQLIVCNTTTFFEDGRAKIWYCKVDGIPELYVSPGFHPITGKGLRHVTNYIVGKYVKK